MLASGGQPADLHNAQLVIGQEVDTSLSTKGTDLRVERVVVTNENVLGKRIRDLHFKERYDVVISRLNRAGSNWLPVAISACSSAISSTWWGVRPQLMPLPMCWGMRSKNCNRFRCCRCLLVSGLGVLLGSIPVFVPGFPAALKLGLAGGPLIMALILGRIGSIGKLYWFYAAKCQPRAAGAGDRGCSSRSLSEIWWGFL
ncbi:putative transport protein YidE [Escherichia coli]|uniref:Putative transport protein YidE n=1 Tax=Escherichia coli TaxID=562 RepID=A0A376MMJ6_ECOLX|nr:putative transport protein YidE [Escherichia coli]